MAITLNLPPELEAMFAGQARALGLELDVYVQTLLGKQAAMGRSEQTINLDHFEAELDALAQGSEKLPNLPPEALTRENGGYKRRPLRQSSYSRMQSRSWVPPSSRPWRRSRVPSFT